MSLRNLAHRTCLNTQILYINFAVHAEMNIADLGHEQGNEALPAGTSPGWPMELLDKDPQPDRHMKNAKLHCMRVRMTSCDH